MGFVIIRSGSGEYVFVVVFYNLFVFSERYL